MGLMDNSTFGERLAHLASLPVRPALSYIIRDAHGPNDHCLVWNWQKQVWGWDIDGDYRDRGWGYKDPFAAKVAKLGTAGGPIRQYRTSGSFWADSHRIYPNNVRVVSEWELYKHMGLEPPRW